MTKNPWLLLVTASIIWISCQTGNSNKNATGGDTLYTQSQHEESYSAKKLKPAEVLSKLKQGNRNFVERLSPSNLAHDSSYNYFEQIAHTGKEQHPVACILTCMDSRVPPEIIFDQGIGSLFVIRIAGNIEDPDVLGSMEYAVAEKGVGVIVVMGHKNCGAINAAFGKVDPGIKGLSSLVEQVKKDVIPGDKAPYDQSAKHNVKLTIDHILSSSKTIHDKFEAGDLIIAGALYDVSNGTIDWNSSDW